MKPLRISIFLFSLLLSVNIVYGNVLDRSGTGPEPLPPANYTCINVNISGNGAKFHDEFFSIEMSGHCFPETGATVLTGSHIKNIGATGNYYFESKIATEKVYNQNGTRIFEVRLSCNGNPWAYGVEQANCTPMEPPTNKLEDIAIQPPYPLTAKHMDPATQAAILAAKNWKSPEEILADWNPYERTGGSTALSFIAPQNLEMINQSVGFYPFQLEQIYFNNSIPDTINYQVETLEDTPEYIGDIKMPDTHEQWWQPFLLDGMSISETDPIILNIGIASGAFSGKPGSYRIRARAYNGQVGHIGGWTSWQYFCVGQPGDSCMTSYMTSGELPAKSLGLKKLDQMTKVLKTMQAADIFFSKNTKESKAVILKKKQRLFDQLMSKNKEMAVVSPLSIVRYKDTDNVLTIWLRNNQKKPLKAQQVEIQSTQNDKVIWSKSITFSTGMTELKIDHKKMVLTSQPKGKRAYDFNLSVNKLKIGTIFITHGAQVRRGKAAVSGKQPSNKMQKTTAMFKPKLNIKLAMRDKNIQSGEKAIIAVSVKNIGKGTLKKTETYSLQCSSTCPFNKTSNKLNKELASNKSFSFKLTSKALKAGNYDLIVKTKFGISNKLTFSVKSSKSVKRGSASTKRDSSGRRQTRKAPSSPPIIK